MIAHLLVAASLALGLHSARAGAQASPARTGSRTADLVLTGGKIFTADSTHPWAEAIALRGNRIAAVGTNAEVAHFAGPRTRRIALGGRVVIPGINDTHTHLAHGALGPGIAPEGDWMQGPGAHPLLDSLAAVARRTPQGTWIRGVMGLRIRGDTALRRQALDRVAPNHPVILSASFGHGSMVNTRALRMLGIPDTAADPVGGWYERAPGTRTITGLLDGSAQYAAWRAYSVSSAESLVVALRDEAAQAAGFGITTVQHMSSTISPAATAQAFAAAALPIRVRVITWPSPGHPDEWRSLANHALTPLTKVSGVKYVVDGTPLEQWALMRQPYRGHPDWHGRLYFPIDSIRRYLELALRNGDQPMLHVVGDSTAVLVMGMMETLAPDSVWRARRPRVEHANGIIPELVPAARRMGVIISQPRGRAGQIRMWERAGLTVAYGSDGPPLNPFPALADWTTAQDSSGAVSRETAMRMFTRNGAFAEFAEHEKGTLAPGMLADLAVLSQNIFTVVASSLPATRSILTIVNGTVILDELDRHARPRAKGRGEGTR